jgi:hypothetical protein
VEKRFQILLSKCNLDRYNKIPFEEIHEFAIINRVGVQGDRPELPERPTAAALQVGLYKSNAVVTHNLA